MKKKSIAWVTPDCFIDVDYNTGVITSLLNYYDIHWIVLLSKGGRFKENDFQGLTEKYNYLTIDYIYFNHRERDIRTLMDYVRVFSLVKKKNADLNYINVVPSNPMAYPLFLLPSHKTIYTAHDGYVKGSFKFSILSKIAFELCFRKAQNINLFSPKQEQIFLNHFIGKKTFVIPLGIKNFGMPTVKLREDKISFLFFGTIHEDKNLSLLIKAGEELYDEGERGFVLSINGSCNNWLEYKKLIHHPDIFELDIRSLDNSEIANLFTYNHYAVFPYKQSAQSGAMKVAMYYNRPVIVSNLDGFLFDIKDRYNGFVFENNNVEALKSIMRHCIKSKKCEYERVRKNMDEYVKSKYSLEVICKMYGKMFMSVLN